MVSGYAGKMYLLRFLFFTAVLVGCVAGCRTLPSPLQVRARRTTSGLRPLRAGVGAARFTPPAGYPLAGYGGGARRQDFPFYFGAGWPGHLALDLHQWWNGDDLDAPPADMLMPALGAHDDLFARALVLEAGGLRVAICRIDAIESSGLLHDRVCELVRPLGLRPEAVLVAATHTHSGVGGFLRSRAAKLAGTDNFRPEVFERIAQATARAIRSACAGLRPAAIGFGRALDRGPGGAPVVAENRRAARFSEISPDDVDPEIGLVKVVTYPEGAPLAVLVNYAVHPTVLRPENLYFSTDLAGAIERAVRKRVVPEGSRPGAPPFEVLFLNGAEGDIGPRGGFGGLQAARRLGDALAAEVAPVLASMPTAHRIDLRLAYGDRGFGDPFTIVALGDRKAFYEADENPVALWATALLTLPVNALLWTLGFFEARVALTYNLTLGVHVNLSAFARTNRYRFHALRLATPDGRTLVLLTVPGEPLHAVGERLKALAKTRGADQTLLLGLTNGALGYVAGAEEYWRGSYEAHTTLYGPDTADLTATSLAELLDTLDR